MRLATRLSLWMTGIVCLIVGLHAIWSTQAAIGRIQDDLNTELRTQAELLATAVSPVLREDGFLSAGRVVTEVRTELPGGARWWRPTAEVPASFTGTKEAWQRLTKLRQSYYVSDKDGHAYFVPIVVNETVRAVLMMRRSLDRQNHELRALVIDRIILTLLMIVGIALGIHWAIRRLIGEPLQALSALSQQIAGGDFSGRTNSNMRDEIGTFSHQMDHMAERLEEVHAALEGETHRRFAAMIELRHAERLKTVGQLASGTAHELGTPLNVIIGRARMISRGLVQGDDLKDSAEIIEAQGHRMTTLIKGLLRFARREPSPENLVDLNEVIEQCGMLLAPLMHKSGVVLEATVPEAPVCVKGDVAQVEQVLTNLIQNATHAMPDGGIVVITLETTPVKRRFEADDEYAPGFVRLTVTDTGVGMEPDVAERVFEPFFTTKPVGEGTGLGLSIAYGIVRDHGGWIDVRSAIGAGATFEMYLPVRVDAPTHIDQPADAPGA
ncbi:MAG: two-component system NtrC family sensor kinase [Bradymonadia bacterium]|jgi:two-component system NtrC family sensor kinase